jgi:YbgC/YbaW family acyl-CoA thioester hydrolase
MTFEFRHKHRVEFSETDMAGIVHFSNFFRYMEMAEHAFHRSLGLSVYTKIDGRTVSWVRVRADCAYQAPLGFEDELEICLSVRKKTKKSITYGFEFSKPGVASIASGSMTVLCVAIDPVTKQMSTIAIPKIIDEKITVAPAEPVRT